MLPPHSQYQIQRTIVPTKYQGKDKEDSSSACRTTKSRTVRFRSICEEFEVTPSRESSPVCEIERKDPPVGSAVFQQILKELYSTEDSAEDSVFCETKCEPLESRPQRSILKVTRLCKAVKKGK